MHLTDATIRSLQPTGRRHDVADDDVKGLKLRVAAGRAKSFSFVYSLHCAVVLSNDRRPASRVSDGVDEPATGARACCFGTPNPRATPLRFRYHCPT